MYRSNEIKLILVHKIELLQLLLLLGTLLGCMHSLMHLCP